MDKCVKILIEIQDTRIELNDQASEVMTTELKNGIEQAVAIELSENVSQKHIAPIFSIRLCIKHKYFLPTTKQHFTIYHNILHFMVLGPVTLRKIVV